MLVCTNWFSGSANVIHGIVVVKSMGRKRRRCLADNDPTRVGRSRHGRRSFDRRVIRFSRSYPGPHHINNIIVRLGGCCTQISLSPVEERLLVELLHLRQIRSWMRHGLRHVHIGLIGIILHVILLSVNASLVSVIFFRISVHRATLGEGLNAWLSQFIVLNFFTQRIKLSLEVLIFNS